MSNVSCCLSKFAQPVYVNNQISVPCGSCAIVGDTLQKANSLFLSRIELHNLKIDSHSCILLEKFFKTNTTVDTLSIQIPIFYKKRIQSLSNILMNNTTLQTLNLGGTLLKNSSIVQIAHSLNQVSITSLLLRGCSLQTPGVIALGTALTTNTTLQTLDISLNPFDSGAIEALGTALSVNTTLTELNLQICFSESSAPLAIGLRSNTTLTSLDISKNNMTEDDAALFGETLSLNTTLSKLCILNMFTKREGYENIARGMKNNFSITSLGLTTLPMDSRDVLLEINQILERNRDNLFHRYATLCDLLMKVIDLSEDLPEEPLTKKIRSSNGLI